MASRARDKIIATIASCLFSVTGGVTFGLTAVLLPQLKNDPDFPYDPAYDSWLASISPLAMLFGCIFAGSMSDVLGRKRAKMLLIIPYTIGWATMGLAPDNIVLLLGRFITGLCAGAIRPCIMVYLGELSEPKYRAAILVSPSLGVYLGGLFSHIIGYYLPWRTSCFVFSISNLIGFVMLMFLKESPLWLISKGRINEGIQSFKEFRGEGEASDTELKSVLEKRENQDTVSSKGLLEVCFSKAFMKSMLNICLLFFAVQFCGINTINFYAQDMFKQTFSGEVDEFMLMIVTDVIRVGTTITVCLFANKIPNRITFLVSCYGTVLLLVGLIVYLFIKPVGLLWLAITCLVLYLGVAGVLTSIAWSFVAELFPSNVRGLGSAISSLISFGFLFISVKITPGILASFGDAVLYCGFAVATLISGVVLTFSLPDTKGKSLQDIENSLYNKKSLEMKPQQS